MQRNELIDDVETEEDATGGPTHQQLADVAAAMVQYRQLERAAMEAAEVAAKAAEAFRQVSENTLPDALTAAGFKAPSKFLVSGCEVEFKHFITAGITEENKPAAFAFLKKVGAEDLIKAEAKLQFPRGAAAKKLLADVLKKLGAAAKKAKVAVKVQQKESVHGQTLGKWVRERLAAGESVDREALGVHEARVATVKQVAPQADEIAV